MADAGRVIAGSARGRRLAAPGRGTRPMGDRVKEALFAALDPVLPGSRVLDLFAGSGAGGIEALSRGAALAVFVERDAGTAEIIRENLRRTGLAGPSAVVVRREVLTFLGAVDGARLVGPFDLVLVDPPYADTEVLSRALEQVGLHVRPGGRVVAKHFWRQAPPAAVGLLASERVRRFGESALTFYRRREPITGEEAHGA